MIFWFTTFYITHFLIIGPIMKSFGSWAEYYHVRSPKQKLYYASYVHGMLHGLIAFTGSVFCFLYADGEPETTWFHCNWFKLNMFDIQKHLNMVSAGYLIF